jgi:hypothetical protein
MTRDEHRLFNCIKDSEERQARAQERIADSVAKPENRFKQALNMVSAGVSILGIITIADIIRRWATGG